MWTWSCQPSPFRCDCAASAPPALAAPLTAMMFGGPGLGEALGGIPMLGGMLPVDDQTKVKVHF